MYIADLDSYLHKRGIERISLGNVRIWSLAYADDVVLVTKNKEVLINIMDILKLFLKEKALELNVSKKRVWFLIKKRKKEKRQKGKSLEKVSQFNHLGFTFNKKGNYTDHIKEIVKKGRLAVNKVWDLKERICKDDFLRRQMLFMYLVKNMIEYKVEIWKWEKKKELEKIMMNIILDRYLGLTFVLLDI